MTDVVYDGEPSRETRGRKTTGGETRHALFPPAGARQRAVSVDVDVATRGRTCF